MADGIFKAHCVFFMTLAYLLRPATRKRPHHEQFEEWGMSPQDWTSTNNQTQKLESTGNKKHATHICTYMYSILHIAVSNRVPTLAINTYVKSSILLCLTMNCLYTYCIKLCQWGHEKTMAVPSTSSIDTPPNSTEDRCLLPCVSPVLRITSIWCGPKHDESV